MFLDESFVYLIAWVVLTFVDPPGTVTSLVAPFWELTSSLSVNIYIP